MRQLVCRNSDKVVRLNTVCSRCWRYQLSTRQRRVLLGYALDANFVWQATAKIPAVVKSVATYYHVCLRADMFLAAGSGEIFSGWTRVQCTRICPLLDGMRGTVESRMKKLKFLNEVHAGRVLDGDFVRNRRGSTTRRQDRTSGCRCTGKMYLRLSHLTKPGDAL